MAPLRSRLQFFVFLGGLSRIVIHPRILVHTNDFGVIDLGHPQHVARVLCRENVVPDDIPDQSAVGCPVYRSPARDFVGRLRIDQIPVVQPSVCDAFIRTKPETSYDGTTGIRQ